MPEEKQDRVTVEDLKSLIRRYADQNLPGWACVGVSIRVGQIGASVTETLVILPADTLPIETSPSASTFATPGE
jgi:hypothetical protein